MIKNFLHISKFKITFTITWLIVSFFIFSQVFSRSVMCLISFGCAVNTLDAILSILFSIFLLPFVILESFSYPIALLILIQAAYSIFIAIIFDIVLPKASKKIITKIGYLFIAITISILLFYILMVKVNYWNHMQDIRSRFSSESGKNVNELFIDKSYGEIINQYIYVSENKYNLYGISYKNPRTQAPSGNVSIYAPKPNTAESLEELFQWYISLNTSSHFQNKTEMIGKNTVVLETVKGKKWRYSWKSEKYVISILSLNQNALEDYLKKYPSTVNPNMILHNN